ncbi:hypothetical protein HOY80DRAFT_1133478 [Tuber brumale]|nr:hypothetical protein HOY80DRAFT_1133478 [Tuber brumale]
MSPFNYIWHNSPKESTNFHSSHWCDGDSCSYNHGGCGPEPRTAIFHGVSDSLSALELPLQLSSHDLGGRIEANHSSPSGLSSIYASLVQDERSKAHHLLKPQDALSTELAWASAFFLVTHNTPLDKNKNNQPVVFRAWDFTRTLTPVILLLLLLLTAGLLVSLGNEETWPITQARAHTHAISAGYDVNAQRT